MKIRCMLTVTSHLAFNHKFLAIFKCVDTILFNTTVIKNFVEIAADTMNASSNINCPDLVKYHLFERKQI